MLFLVQGICIIINNEFFSDRNKHPPRCGTDVDGGNVSFLKSIYAMSFFLFYMLNCHLKERYKD